MQLDMGRRERRAVAVLAARIYHVQIETRQAPGIHHAAGMQRAGQEFQRVAFAAAIGPAQRLVARRFIDVLGPAIAEAMQGEILGGPAQGAMRALAFHRKAGEHHIDVERKAGNRLAGIGQSDARHCLMPVQGIEFFVEQAGHDPPMRHRPAGNGEKHRQRRIQPETGRKTQPHLEYPQDRQESQPSTCTKLASPQRGQKCAGAPSRGIAA